MEIKGNVTIEGDVIISGKVRISGTAKISGNAVISDQVLINGTNIIIAGNAQIGERAMIRGNAQVDGDASVNGRARIMENAHVTGTATLSGSTIVKGDTVLKSGSFDKGVANADQQNTKEQGQQQAPTQQQKLDPKQAYTIAMEYLDGINGKQQSEEKAFQHFKIAAEGGHLEGAFMLGDCYTLGQGTIKDLRRGTAWYKKAGEKGHVQAMYFTAMAYNYGDGVNEDQREAMRWFERAAEHKHLASIQKLIDIAIKGKDAETSKRYLLIAAELGDKEAQQKLQQLGVHGENPAFEQAMNKLLFPSSVDNLSQAIKELQALKNDGNHLAGIKLAHAHEHGLSGERDLDAAEAILRDLANNGSVPAKAELAIFLLNHKRGQETEIEN